DGVHAMRMLAGLSSLLVLCGWSLASTGAPADASPAASSQDPGAPTFQPWVKRGVIIQPGFARPMSSKLVSCPSVVRLKNGRLRMYFWAADGVPPWHGRHVILAAEADPQNPLEWKLVSQQPLLGPDPSNNIRDRGVSFPYVLPRD